MPAIFISHSSLDKERTNEIRTFLANLKLEQVFLDYDEHTGIPIGANWEKRLHDELARCHAVILVLTSNWLASKWCFAELFQARALGKVILPVICEPLGGRQVLPEIQAGEILDWNDAGAKMLKRSLDAITHELARGFTLDPNRAPYPGIHAFEVEDAAIYFGRDAETRGVIERLNAQRVQGGSRLIIVIGASGSGKSSLLKAGVLPQLARRPADWITLPPIRPERAPVEALAKAIAQHLKTPEHWRKWHSTLNAANAFAEFAEFVKDARVGEARAATLLLPIDQFEEVFTVAASHERSAFLNFLAAALNPAGDLPVIALATGRSDVLGSVIEAGEFARIVETYPLFSMPLDRIPTVIEGPAATAGLNVEKGLSERMAKDVKTAEALPLLAYTLSLLYYRGIVEKRLTVADYLSLGDPARSLNPIENSIRLVADRTIDALDPSESELAALRDAFVPHLVRVRLDDASRVRQSALLSELPPDSGRLIKALVTARLLSERGGKDSGASSGGGGAVIEVTHEALFVAWPRLDRWLTEEHAFLSDIERIKGAYEIWLQAPPEQKTNALLNGLLLLRARDWLLKYPQRFGGTDMEPRRAFIVASAAAEDEKRAKQEALRRTIQWVTTAALAFTTAVAVVAIYLWRDAQAQHDKLLLAQSTFLANVAFQQMDHGNAVSAALTALEGMPDERRGMHRPESADSLRALYEAFYQSRELHIFPGHNGAVVDLAVSPDGRRLLSASEDETVGLWDLARGQQLLSIRGYDAGAAEVLFNPNGLDFLTRDVNGNVRIFTYDGSKELKRFDRERDGAMLDCAFSPDGRFLAITLAGMTHRVVVFETAGWTPVAHLTDAAVPASGHVAFNPDGSLLASEQSIWSTKDWSVVSTIEERPDLARSLSFNADSEWLIMSAFSQRPNKDPAPGAMIWNVKSGKLQMALGGHITNVLDENVANAALSPTQPLALLAGSDGVRAFNRDTGRLEFVLHEGAFVNQVIFSPDGKRIATAGSDQTARIYDATNGEELAVLAGHAGEVTRIIFIGDGTRLLTASRDGTIRLWRIDALGEKRVSPMAWPLTHILTSSGRTYVIGEGNEHLYLWDLESGRQIDSAAMDDDAVGALAVAINQTTMRIQTTFNRTAGGTGYLWDRASGNRIVIIYSDDGKASAIGPRSPDAVSGLAETADFSPDGTKLVIGGNYPQVLDARTGRLLVKLNGHSGAVEHAVFSANGQLIGTAGGDGRAMIWDAATGARRAAIDAQSGPLDFVAFNPKGTAFVTISSGGKARIWDVSSGRLIAELEGDVYRLVHFDSSGKQLAGVGSFPNGRDEIRIWNVDSGKLFARVPVRPDDTFADSSTLLDIVAFARNGSLLVTHTKEGEASLWPIFGSSQQLIEKTIAVVPRCLTLPERAVIGLGGEPPVWCIEMQKWPYQAPEWQSRLAQKRAGGNPGLPIK